MGVKLSPYQFFGTDANGDPLNAYQVFCYEAGTTTKQTVYQDSGGAVAHANPIILDTLGFPSAPIWLTDGQDYKFVVASPTDTDPPVGTVRTFDNISGINDVSVTVDEWIEYTEAAPTFVDATSFTLAGDETSEFHIGRRIKTTNSGGTIYSTITNSVFTTLTTITVVNDSGSLDSGLSALWKGVLRANNSSIPGVETSQDDWTFQGNTTMEGTLAVTGISTLASGSTIGNLTLADGSITDSSGAISFGNENLSTTGTFGSGAPTFSGDLTFSQSNPEILGGDASGRLFIGADVNVSTGANMWFAGSTASAIENDFALRKDTTDVIRYDDSISRVTISPGTVISGTLNVNSAFTSVGIDDNATEEVFELSDTVLSVGNNTSASNFTIRRPIDDGRLILRADNGSNGGRIDLYGGNHASLADNVYMYGGGAAVWIWDNANNEHELRVGDVRIYDGDLKFVKANPNIIGGDSDGVLSISADTATTTGGNIILSGSSQASTGGDFQFRTGTTSIINYDHSITTTTIQNCDVAIGSGSASARLHVVDSVAGDVCIIESTEAGASDGPDLVLYRNSASPADNDDLGSLIFRGKDSGGNDTDYCKIDGEILDVTDTTEDAYLQFITIVAGSSTARARIGGGYFTPGATGGDKGNNTINASAVYDDNVLLTCYIRDIYQDAQRGLDLEDPAYQAALFDKWDYFAPDRSHPAEYGKKEILTTDDGLPVLHGSIELADNCLNLAIRGPIKRPVIVKDARQEKRTHAPLRKFLNRVIEAQKSGKYNPLTLEGQWAHFIDKGHLTPFPNADKFDPVADKEPIGARGQKDQEMLELMLLYIHELEQRVQTLETPIL